MTRRQKDPLRPLTEEERAMLLAISRSRTEPAAHVERAKLILAVADGASYTAAAHSVGRRCNDPVADLVRRFNREGVSAIEPGHGGGASMQYGADARERVLRSFAAPPTVSAMAPSPGRSPPCNGPCVRLPMACRALAPTSLGRSSTTPATPGNATAPGATPARSNASGKAAL